jgi:cytochrome c biogenesis protein CcdA
MEVLNFYIKSMKNKKIVSFLVALICVFLGKTTFASDYTYYYWESCSHCYELDKFFKKNDIYKKYDIEKKEVYSNVKNNKELLKQGEKFWLPLSEIGIPFLVYDNETKYLKGTPDIKDHFLSIEKKSTTEETGVKQETKTPQEKTTSFFAFLLILLPAAFSDSINPCAFAVLFLLLSSILSKTSSFRRTIFAWLLFCFAVFISYFLMGVWIYKVFSFSDQIFYIKLWVGILGILVGLANIKDYFWYGKGFVMEVPFSWRPRMKKIMSSISSPFGGFLAGFVISLFLLPCSSWPYFTILWYLVSESSSINMLGYTYLLIYNIVFILPMVIITFVIGLGIKDISELKELKETHKENIHLIVWIMMILLWIYLLYEAFL